MVSPREYVAMEGLGSFESGKANFAVGAADLSEAKASWQVLIAGEPRRLRRLGV